MRTLIIGAGEVGSSLQTVIEEYHETFIRDIEPFELKNVGVLMICFPYTDKFVEQVKNYKLEYSPKLTIINSSVEVGVTEKCGEHVVYSPIRGRHRPRLADELKTFVKFIAGKKREDIELAGDYFSLCEWEVWFTNDIRGLELCKLVSNIHMGLEIAWAQEMDRLFRKSESEIDTYKKWEETYNVGYKRLNQLHIMRPIMKPDPIGGHCILECTDILSKQFKSLAFEFIKKSNAEARGLN